MTVDNYLGISLLSTAGKIQAKILLKRLQTIAELILPESQYGFRTSRSTIDMIFALRHLQEKAVEQQQSLYMIFVDLSKAFNTVDRSTLWILLRRYRCPETFVKVIQELTMAWLIQCLLEEQLQIHLKSVMD